MMRMVLMSVENAAENVGDEDEEMCGDDADDAGDADYADEQRSLIRML